jgi:hypothetical protein
MAVSDNEMMDDLMEVRSVMVSAYEWIAGNPSPYSRETILEAMEEASLRQRRTILNLRHWRRTRGQPQP